MSDSTPAPIQPRWWRSSRAWLLSGLVLVTLVAGGFAAYWQFGRAKQADPLQTALEKLDAGDITAARTLYGELKSSPNQKATAAFLRGAMLLRKGYAYPALDDLQVAAADSQHKIRARILIGEAWYHLGRQIEAQAAWREVLEANPDSVEANRWMAASLYDQGAIHEAIHFLERTAELAPEDPRPHRLLGLINKDYERYDVAIPLYQESLRRDRHQADANDIRLELAACQTKQLKHRDALATLKGSPETKEVLILKAECHYAEGDIAIADSLLDAVLEADPDNLDALVLKGTLLLEEGDPKDAVATLKRATQKHPMDYLAHFKLHQAYVKAGDEAPAKAERDEAERIRLLRQEFALLHQEAWDNPEDRGVRLRLASMAQQLNRPDLAEVWLKSANALRPSQTEQQ